MNDLLIFDDRLSNDNPYTAIDFVEQFDLLINEYISKGSPVVLFRKPIVKADSAYAKCSVLPILSYEDVACTEYLFYKETFKAVLMVEFSDYEDRIEFENKHFKKCTIVEHSNETCSFA